jgi:hypothetical protein
LISTRHLKRNAGERAGFGRNLVLILLSVFFFSGCSVSLFKGYQKDPGYTGAEPVSWFVTDSGHFLFSTKIDMMKNHLSGLMVIKPMTGDTYRVVFITEVGLKIFDMEFFAAKPAKVHYIIEAMDRNIVVNTLTNDIGLILMTRISGLKPNVFRDKSTQKIAFRYRDNGKKYYYQVSGDEGRFYKVVHKSGMAGKVHADLYGNEVSGIDSIKISHFNVKLSINLYRIIEDSNHAAE